MTTASEQGNAFAKVNGFTFQRTEGYVYANNTDGTLMPMEMWYSAQRDDHFLVGTADNRANAIGAGYVLQYVDCFVPVEWVVWPTVIPSGSPFPMSTDLLDYEFAYGQAAVPPGIGADTWYPSWTDTGEGRGVMVSSWTDGSVDGVQSSSGDRANRNATTGIAIIHGDSPWNLTLSGVATVTEPAMPYQGRYPSVNQFVKGVWYYGTYSLENFNGNGVNPGPDCGNWCVLGPLTDIRYSTDMGSTWSMPRQVMHNWTDNLWHEEAVHNSKVVMGAPHAVDFGQNLMHSPDGRMYLVGTGAVGPASYQSWMQGDSVHLARTVAAPDPTRINDPTFWEFYCGGAGSAAVWSSPGNVSAAAPLFVWPNRTGVVTASYNPILSKYLMVVSTPTTSPYTIYHFDTYLLEADDLTSQWSMVAYMPSFGPQAYFVHWPSKFMGAAPLQPAEHINLPRRRARPGASERANSTQPGHDWDALTEPLTNAELASHKGATYYTSYLSYSGNFASGYAPNPPGTGYHWTLQQSRMQLSDAFAARLAAVAQSGEHPT